MAGGSLGLCVPVPILALLHANYSSLLLPCTFI